VSGDAVAEFLRLASAPSVVRRALLYAVVVGSLLIAINHGDAVLSGEITSGRLLKMGLTVLVPYAVSTLSSVSALREPRR
jgi:hypothetical protein